MEKKTRGKPRTFKSGEELLKLYEGFCEEIKENDYNVVPYITEFCRWINNGNKKADRRTIYLSIYEYYPQIKKEIEQLQGEVMSQGAILGKYKETSTIFALKCKCGWSEDNEQTKGSEDKQNSLIKAIKNVIK